MLAVWEALRKGLVLPRDQANFWPLIEQVCSSYPNLCMQYLKDLPSRTGQLQKLVPMQQQLAMITITAAKLKPKATASVVLPFDRTRGDSSSTAVSNIWQGIAEVSSLDYSTRKVKNCEQRWFTAWELPMAGAARASSPGRPSFLRLLLSADAPAEIFLLPAGEPRAVWIPLTENKGRNHW